MTPKSEGGFANVYKPSKPEFHVGQIVVDTFLFHSIGKIKTIVSPDIIIYIKKDNISISSHATRVRLATPDEIDEFFTGEIGEKRVRAYENKNGNILIVWEEEKYALSYLLQWYTKEARVICEKFNIPIHPYVEGMEMKPPKARE